MEEDNFEEQEPWCDPEDCEECGCPAGDFEDSDYVNGAWQCPECGSVQ